MLPFNSPRYWIISLLVFAGLLGGLYFYGTFVWRRVEPAIKARVEQRLGVKLDYSLSHFWNIADASWDTYPGNRVLLWLTVTALNFTVVLGLAVTFIVPLAILWLILAYLSRAR
jgi:hypothetical protein